ncbi:hypothetical protein B0H14DRAFT_2576552 [Mycena olivaceomarginata]|nr:hypothetical protein B0H14DRAFT_2576552 [Mycena olivaceomarginata]
MILRDFGGSRRETPKGQNLRFRNGSLEHLKRTLEQPDYSAADTQNPGKHGGYDGSDERARFRYYPLDSEGTGDSEGDGSGGQENSDDDMDASPHEKRPRSPHSKSDEEEADDESESDADPSYVGLARTRLLDEFCRFLTEAAEPPTAAVRNDFQDQLFNRMDYTYPYNEQAPSQRRVLEPDGPFCAVSGSNRCWHAERPDLPWRHIQHSLPL